ncbi:AGAP002708-PB, partial [Anopheles gambiae str. PEST]
RCHSFCITFAVLIPTLPDVELSIRCLKHHHERHWGPFLEERVNVTSGAALQVGYHLSTEAILNCRVGMLKDKTVMWIRRTTDKVSLLTVGNNTYSGDPRIKVKFQYPNNWRLHINPIKSDDAGLYMCQVSTHPPRVFATNLTVLEPAVRIVDEMGYEFSDRYYKLGSTIEISCQVSTSYLATLPPSPKSAGQQQRSKTSPVGASANALDETAKTGSKATKDDNKLSDSTERGLISWTKDGAELPKDVKMSFSGTKQWLISRISILQANRVHNGVYNCTVAGKQSQAAQVQVLNGETPAAVQHNFGHHIEATGLVGLHCPFWCGTLYSFGSVRVGLELFATHSLLTCCASDQQRNEQIDLKQEIKAFWS